MANIPSPLTFSEITGSFISILADSSDADALPDILPLNGTVTITPNIAVIRITGATPQIAIAQSIQAPVVNGVIKGPDGVSALHVLATDSPGINPTAFQYTASFSLQGTSVQPPSIVFNAPGGQTIDLTTVIPSASQPAVQTVVSETSRTAAEAAAASAQYWAGVAQSAAGGGGGGGGSVAWADITGKPATFAPAAHSHAQSDITGLATALSGKANTSHTHAESDITGLVSDLAAKAPLASPTFTGTVVAPTPTTGDNTTKVATTAFVTTALAGVSGGSPGVTSVNTRQGAVTLAKSDVGLGNVDNTADADKPVSTAQSSAIGAKYTKPGTGIPATDLTTAVQTSLGKADSALQSAPVTSVASKTGAVTLTKSDVGLANVDNTADTAKPISSATQTALDGKVPTTRTVAGKALSADVSLVKGDVGLGNVDNTADTAKPISTATQTALDGKSKVIPLAVADPDPTSTDPAGFYFRRTS